MSAVYGPYVQMGKLAQYLAAHYQKDLNLEMEPLLAHFLEEVEINVAADDFDHTGFMNRLQGPLRTAAVVAENPRRKEFLLAIADALEARIGEQARPAIAVSTG